MRVVIDTNVWVPGVINPHGVSGRIVDRAIAGAFTLLNDDRIMNECREVMARPKFAFDPGGIDSLLNFIEAA